jgi:uncharacterized protein (TIGR03437 family)
VLLAAASVALAAERLPVYRWTSWFETITLTAAVAAPDGGVYVVGRRSPDNPLAMAARISATGEVMWTRQIDSTFPPITDAAGAAIDRAGNLYIAGRGVRSAAIGGIWSLAAVAVLAPDGAPLRAHLFGGTANSRASAVGIDSAGSVWVAGSTDNTQFPDGNPGQASPFGRPSFGFLERLAPDGTVTRFRLIGGQKPVCSGGSGCIGRWGYTSLSQIAFSPEGLVAASGYTTSIDMSVTPNAIQKSSGGGVLMIVDADGKALLETYLGGHPQYISHFPCGTAAVNGIAFDASAMLYAAGTNGGIRPETTPGALQATAPESQCGEERDIGFLYRIDPRSGKVLFSTLTGAETGSATGLFVRENKPWIAGTAGASFPVTPGEFTRGPNILAAIAPDGASVAASTRLPGGVDGKPVPGPNGRLFLVGEHAVHAFDEDIANAPVLFGVANAGGRPVSQWLAPGEVVSLYGNGIGPSEPLHAELDWEGRIGTDLAGVRVFFTGRAAPLLYADSEQINAIVPFMDPIVPLTLQLVHNDRVVLNRIVHLAAADPAFLAPCWNTEGKLNSRSDPAAPGEILACWISGLGELMPRPADGEVPVAILPKPRQPVAVSTGSTRERPGDVLYLGQAPMAPAGVVQLNVRVPPREWESQDSQVLRVTAAGRTASTTIYLRQGTIP